MLNALLAIHRSFVAAGQNGTQRRIEVARRQLSFTQQPSDTRARNIRRGLV